MRQIIRSSRSWKEIVADLPKMKGWRRGGQEGVLEKRDIFLLEDSSEVPEWGNTTRVAQLARQLREEVIRWLGIRRGFDQIADPKDRDNQIANKIVDRIGTPTGFMTGCLPRFMAGSKQSSARFQACRSGTRRKMQKANRQEP